MSVKDLAATPAGQLIFQQNWRLVPLTVILAILMFMTALATALGLSLLSETNLLNSQLSNRITVQIVEPDANIRKAQTSALVKILQAQPGVSAVQLVDDAHINELLAPWLGTSAATADLPSPSLIDAQFSNNYIDMTALKSELLTVAPSAQITNDIQWFTPIMHLLTLITSLTMTIVILIGLAMAAAVALSARAALTTHYASVEILHHIGATDAQIMRLFRRTISTQAAVAGIIGLGAGFFILLMIKSFLNSMNSDLVNAGFIAWWVWLVLLLLPFGGVGLAIFAANSTMRRSLRSLL